MTTLCSITLPVNDLRAIHTFAPKKDNRYYLMGVNVLYNVANQRVELAATCGNILGVLTINPISLGFEVSGENHIPKNGFIIPSDMIPTKGKRGELITFALMEDGSLVRSDDHQMAGATLVGRAIDGAFPDYHRIIPDRNKNGALTEFPVHVENAAAILKACKLFNGGIPTIHFGEDRHTACTTTLGGRDDVIMVHLLPRS